MTIDGALNIFGKIKTLKGYTILLYRMEQPTLNKYECKTMTKETLKQTIWFFYPEYEIKSSISKFELVRAVESLMTSPERTKQIKNYMYAYSAFQQITGEINGLKKWLKNNQDADDYYDKFDELLELKERLKRRLEVVNAKHSK